MPLTQVSSRAIEDTLRYVLGASGTDHYTFTGKGLNGAVNDPTLTLSRGHTYIFENRSGGHPFYIKTSIANGGTNDAYNTGVTNNGGGNGTEIVFTVPHDAPDLLYYQCSSHSSMAGQLKIAGAVTDGSITESKLADDAVTEDKLANSINTAIAANTAKVQTTINSNADNKVITGSNTANTLNAETNLIYDGLRLGINRTPTANADYPLQVKSANATAFAHFRSSQSAGDDPNTNGGLVGLLNDDMYLWGRESNSRIILGTNNAERMRIDESGIVTKPYTPSFSANSGSSYWTHGSSTGTLDIDTITTELFDIGGNYNSSSCVFTAPVAGKYFFTLTYAYVCTSGYLNIHLKKGVSGTYSTYGKMFASPPQQSSAYQGAPVTGIIELAAGNTVKPMAELNYSGNQLVNVSFTGYLIG